jgi:hypothetical protein
LGEKIKSYSWVCKKGRGREKKKEDLLAKSEDMNYIIGTVLWA